MVDVTLEYKATNVSYLKYRNIPPYLNVPMLAIRIGKQTNIHFQEVIKNPDIKYGTRGQK
jgi:hypothetical protein